MLYNNLLYFDIETTSQYKTLGDFQLSDPYGYQLFKKKYAKNKLFSDNGQTIEQAYIEQAPLYSTYGKIVCISFGYFKNNDIIINSIYGEDERDIVNSFNDLLFKVHRKHMMISGFAVNIFDIPWVLHKLNKYDIEPSPILDIYLTKPWDIKSIDLSDEWKQRFTRYSTLEEVSYELDIENPKNDMCGDMVYNVYWNEHDGLERIKTYCEADVKSSMQIGERLLKYKL